MASPYLAGGSKPGFAGKAASLTPNEKAAPVKVVQVRAHTRTIPVKQPAPVAQPPPVKQPAAAKPAGESLGHSILRMRNQKFTDGQIAGQIRKWHPNLTPQQVSTIMERAPKQLPGQRLGAMFVGLPRDYGQGHLFEPKPYSPAQGHAAAPPVQNLHVGDPLGVVSAVKDVGKFIHHPGVGTGLGAGLAAASFLPGGKGLRGAADVAKGLTAGEDVAKVAAHTTEEAGAVREALKGAPNVRGAQAGDFSAQRRARFAKAEAIYRDTSLTPEERQAQASSALKGSLERPVFTGFKKMTPDAVTNTKAQIMGHPTLRTGQKTTLLRSLDRAVGGIVPTAGEHKLFTQVFGKEAALGISKAAKTGRWKNVVTNVINVPRTLQATLDMSSFLRQGAVALARHPVITGRNFKTLVHSFASEDAALKVESDIASRPNYPLMKAGKVSFTGSGDLQPQEEQFGANMLENLGGTKNPIRWSSRSYSAFLNKTRADIFDHLVGVAHTQGHNIHDEKFLRDLGNMVNVFTGRGSLPGDWERAAKVFNGIFFSPRLMSSRLQMLGQPLNPALHPFARRQYQRALTQSFGALVSVLGLAKLNGLNVGTDPRSADFGKIKFGNTRVDLGAGFLQYAHLAGQLATGGSKSSTSGKVSNIYSGKFGQRSAHDVVSGFFEGKLSPPLGALDDVLRQQTGSGPFNIWQELVNHLTPLSSQDIYGVATNRSKGGLGAAEVAGAGALSIFGGGLQTYKAKAPKGRAAKPQSYLGSKSSGGSQYLSPSSKQSGSPYLK